MTLHGSSPASRGESFLVRREDSHAEREPELRESLECEMCGTPVIASDVGGLGYLVRDGETVFGAQARERRHGRARFGCRCRLCLHWPKRQGQALRAAPRGHKLRFKPWPRLLPAAGPTGAAYLLKLHLVQAQLNLKGCARSV